MLIRSRRIRFSQSGFGRERHGRAVEEVDPLVQQRRSGRVDERWTDFPREPLGRWKWQSLARWDIAAGEGLFGDAFVVGKNAGHRFRHHLVGRFERLRSGASITVVAEVVRLRTELSRVRLPKTLISAPVLIRAHPLIKQHQQQHAVNKDGVPSQGIFLIEFLPIDERLHPPKRTLKLRHLLRTRRHTSRPI